MILATYNRPISELPAKLMSAADLEYGHSIYGYWPFCEMTEMRYGDGGDNEISYSHFRELVGRTGLQIYGSVIPLRDKVCGVCHEIIGMRCPDASSCDSSKFNSYCCHADNAGVYPFLEWMFYILFIGGLIPENIFIQHTAWMRALGKKLYGLDRIASTQHRSTANFQNRFMGVFGVNAPNQLPVSADELLVHNKALQRRFSPKISSFTEHTQHLIRKCMREKWQPKNGWILPEGIFTKIVGEAKKISESFWTIEPPGVQ